MPISQRHPGHSCNKKFGLLALLEPGRTHTIGSHVLLQQKVLERLIRFGFVLGDYEVDSRKQEFALGWVLLGSCGRSLTVYR